MCNRVLERVLWFNDLTFSGSRCWPPLAVTTALPGSGVTVMGAGAGTGRLFRLFIISSTLSVLSSRISLHILKQKILTPTRTLSPAISLTCLCRSSWRIHWLGCGPGSAPPGEPAHSPWQLSKLCAVLWNSHLKQNFILSLSIVKLSNFIRSC